jgi:hypothetical protein
MPEEPTDPNQLDPQIQPEDPTELSPETAARVQPQPEEPAPEAECGGQPCPGPHVVVNPEEPAPEPLPDKKEEDCTLPQQPEQ